MADRRSVIQTGAAALGLIAAGALAALGLQSTIANGWLIALSVAALTVVGTVHGWAVVSVVFRIADPPRAGNASDELVPPAGTMRGGTTIGVLERATTIVALACGQPAVIAVVVAIKAIGRFGELDGAVMRERFLVGSLASVGTAGLWGVAAWLLVT